MAHFTSEELSGKVEKDYDDFLTIRVTKLKLKDEHITAMVLCMDHVDVMDMLESLIHLFKQSQSNSKIVL